MNNQIRNMERKVREAEKDMQYETAWNIEQDIFNLEKVIFLAALDNFKQATMVLANSWIACNKILDDLTMGNSYPFEQDFQSVELQILKWEQELTNRINNYKESR